MGRDPYREEEEGGVNVIKVPGEARFGVCRNEQRMVHSYLHNYMYIVV